jgi:HAD superfamily hydrolase (TIGR01662 family)
MTASVDAVAFDLWNTLIAAAPGYNPYPRIQRLFGLANEDDFREVMRTEWMTRPGVHIEQFYRTACERLGRDEVPVELEQFVEIWEDYLTHVEVLPGVYELLEDLRGRGLKTAIVTNTVEPSIQMIRGIGLTEHVDVLVASSECGYLKPDPRIFQRALDELGVSANQCAVVGDKLRTDILGGLILGMRTILLEARYGRATRSDRLPINAVIPKVTDLVEVL